MNNLVTTEIPQTIDSREVAQMVKKQHSELLKDIRRYANYLNEGNFHLVEFFQESTYKDTKGEIRPCYNVTKKGCEFIAHKLTGQKGAIFTATYINRFHELEQGQAIQTSQLSPELQMFKQIFDGVAKVELQNKQLQTELQGIREAIIVNPKEEWRVMTQKLLNKISNKTGDYKTPKTKAYEALEARGKCKLKIRLDNLRGRALSNGMARSKADALNYLDVIANDARLKEIYIIIVKQMAIKYGVL